MAQSTHLVSAIKTDLGHNAKERDRNVSDMTFGFAVIDAQHEKRPSGQYMRLCVLLHPRQYALWSILWQVPNFSAKRTTPKTPLYALFHVVRHLTAARVCEYRTIILNLPSKVARG